MGGPRLLRIEGGLLQGEFVLADGAVAGRAPTAAIRLIDQSVSREHARFYRAGADWWVRDLGSRNGVWVNQRRIDAEILHAGDEIRLGQLSFVFSDPGAAPRETVILDRGASAPSPPPPPAPVPADAADPAAATGGADPLELEPLVDRILRRSIRAAEARFGALLLRSPGGVELGYREARDADGRRCDDVAIDSGAVERALATGTIQHLPGSVVLPLADGCDRIGVVALVAPDSSDETFGERAAERVADLIRSAAEHLRAALRISRSEARLEAERSSHADVDGEIIGESPEIRCVVEMAERVAPTDATVLVQGETGTGKELIARLIHRRSPRADGPFVAVNCAAVAPTLFESELFGHERGAFTGAVRAKPGRLELASSGTLFLDEVAELPAEAQAKILRALQERVIERVGGSRSIPIDVRFVAATNRDLKADVRSGRFRRDLYYRLGVVTVCLPPLRERGDDVLMLARWFLARFARRLGKKIDDFEPDAVRALVSCRWPGNVRELANAVHRAVVLAETPRVRARDLGADPADRDLLERDPGEVDSYRLEDIEAVAVARALRRTGWKKGEAARLLGISSPTLNKKIERYGIRRDSEDR